MWEGSSEERPLKAKVRGREKEITGATNSKECFPSVSVMTEGRLGRPGILQSQIKALSSDPGTNTGTISTKEADHQIVKGQLPPVNQ